MLYGLFAWHTNEAAFKKALGMGNMKNNDVDLTPEEAARVTERYREMGIKTKESKAQKGNGILGKGIVMAIVLFVSSLAYFY